MKAWSYLEIIDLRPHPDPTGGLPRSGGFNWPFRGTKHTVSEEGPGGAAFVWRLFQGRNMVYPGPIDPYFLAVILIPEPHFPQHFDP